MPDKEKQREALDAVLREMMGDPATEDEAAEVAAMVKEIKSSE